MQIEPISQGSILLSRRISKMSTAIDSEEYVL